jgi:hypothetical protein
VTLKLLHAVTELLTDHSCRAVYGMTSLRPLKRWDRVFESHSKNGCLCACILCCVVLCAGSDLETGWSPVHGILPTVYTIRKLEKRS